MNSAVIRNREGGYVFCEGVNHLIRPEFLQGAAEVIVGCFLPTLPFRPTKVLGVPQRGRELGTALGLEAGLSIAVTERIVTNGDANRELQAEYNIGNDMLVIRHIHSFTKPGQVFTHLIRGVKPGDVVLVTDDFSALGVVTDHYLRAFETLGIRAAFAYLIAKDFPFLDPPQTGFRTHKEQGYNVFAVVRLTGMQDGRVIATAEDL